MRGLYYRNSLTACERTLVCIYTPTVVAFLSKHVYTLVVTLCSAVHMLTTRIYVCAMFPLCGQQWKLILDMYSLHVVTETLTSNINKLSHMHTIHTLTYVHTHVYASIHSHTYAYVCLHTLTHIRTYVLIIIYTMPPLTTPIHL